MGACCATGRKLRGESESVTNSNASELKHFVFTRKKIRMSPKKCPSSQGSDNTDANSCTNIPFLDDLEFNEDTSVVSNGKTCRRSGRLSDKKFGTHVKNNLWTNSIKSNKNHTKSPVLSPRNPMGVLQCTGLFMKTLKSFIPITLLQKNIKQLHDRFPKVLPYVTGAVLGFSKINQSLNDHTTWYRPRRLRKKQTFKRPSQNRMSTDVNLSEDSPVIINENIQEHVGWWRYTMFLLENASDLQEFPIKGTSLIGLENRTGCEIKLSENRFFHRGRTVRQVFIDGPSQIAIMRCKTSIPLMMSKNIIQDSDEPFSGEMCKENLISRFGSNVSRIGTKV